MVEVSGGAEHHHGSGQVGHGDPQAGVAAVAGGAGMGGHGAASVRVRGSGVFVVFMVATRKGSVGTGRGGEVAEQGEQSGDLVAGLRGWRKKACRTTW
ncbi:hypothetical protein GCM10009759_13260 [Kitasatospora saccharophila]|uniref:Uncharacterized protein n=1 Tax=Kitasatospora saccharophila TaxID=407973 RepID=A0ABP5HYN3_9ACTN